MNDVIERAEHYAKTGNLQEAMNLPVAPNGEKVDEVVNTALDNEKIPDKKEEKEIKKKIRKIWGNYRNNVLSQIDLENYKKFCELEEIRAESDMKLARIKRAKEKEEAEHWLEMHKGNLKEIGYNTESVPNKYFYSMDRLVFYLKNRFKNIPKITWYILAGVLGIGIVILMALGISKLF